MSSPRRATKEALERAAKAARGSRPATPSQLQGKVSAKGAATEARCLAAAIERGIADGNLDVLPADALQVLLAAACRLYAARRDAGEQLTPVARNALSATDVMVTASGLLRAADLAAFELGLWQGWTGR